MPVDTEYLSFIRDRWRPIHPIPSRYPIRISLRQPLEVIPFLYVETPRYM